MIVERARIRPTLDGEIVHEHVDVIGGDTGLHEFTGQPKNVGGHGACMTHALDDLG